VSKKQELEDLRGKTLKVYRHVMKVGKPIRLVDIQRDLGFSSASLAQYHLKKLEAMGLVREEQEGYVVDRMAFQQVFRIRRTLIPFQLAYVLFFSFTLVTMVFLLQGTTLTSFDVVAFGANAAALIVTVYEAYRVLRLLY
jgi:DNA-binding transcriptional ArsR family regulator